MHLTQNSRLSLHLSGRRRSAGLVIGICLILLPATGAQPASAGDDLTPPHQYCATLLPTVYGGPEGGEIHGTPGNDVIFAVNGSHRVYAGRGDDVICTFGFAPDYITGGPGNDQIYAVGSADELDGDDGNDLIFGGEGPDTIEGGPGDDELYGESGDDLVFGNRGHDLGSGGPGGDRCFNVEQRYSCGTITKK